MLVSAHQFMQQTCSGRGGKCSCGSLERAPRGLPVWPTPKAEVPHPDRSPSLPVGKSLQQESCRRGRNQTLCSFFSLSHETPAYAVNTFRSGLAPLHAPSSPGPAFLVFESFATPCSKSSVVGGWARAAVLPPLLPPRHSWARAPRSGPHGAKINWQK